MPEVSDTTRETIMIQFVAPKLFLFEDYRFTLLKESEIKPLSVDRYYRPDYVSYDEYGTINLWAMLLFINDIPTIEDFNVANIRVPSKGVILRLTDAATERKTLLEVVKLYDIPLLDTPPLFSKKKSIPNSVTIENSLPSFTPSDMYFMRDSYTLDIVDVRNRYIDLSEEPVPESVVLNITGEPNYLKGKHYDIIKGKKGNNRLTWDPRRISSGIGLVDVMVEGAQFEVTYAKRVRI